MLIAICDECGKKPALTISLATGYVYIDNIYHGQSADLCEKHYPKNGSFQPNHCNRVRFHWPNPCSQDDKV